MQKKKQLQKRLDKLLKVQRQMQGGSASVPVDDAAKVRTLTCFASHKCLCCSRTIACLALEHST